MPKSDIYSVSDFGRAGCVGGSQSCELQVKFLPPGSFSFTLETLSSHWLRPSKLRKNLLDLELGSLSGSERSLCDVKAQVSISSTHIEAGHSRIHTSAAVVELLEHHGYRVALGHARVLSHGN